MTTPDPQPGPTPEEIAALSEATARLTRQWLDVAQADLTPPGAQAASLVAAAAIILGAEWQGGLADLQKAWDDLCRGYGLGMLLHARETQERVTAWHKANPSRDAH